MYLICCPVACYWRCVNTISCQSSGIRQRWNGIDSGLFCVPVISTRVSRSHPLWDSRQHTMLNCRIVFFPFKPYIFLWNSYCYPIFRAIAQFKLLHQQTKPLVTFLSLLHCSVKIYFFFTTPSSKTLIIIYYSSCSKSAEFFFSHFTQNVQDTCKCVPANNQIRVNNPYKNNS